jgi:hypothetical protein
MRGMLPGNFDPCPGLFVLVAGAAGFVVVRLMWYALRRPDLDEPEEPPEAPTD